MSSNLVFGTALLVALASSLAFGASGPFEIKGVRLGESRTQIAVDVGMPDCPSGAQLCPLHAHDSFKSLGHHKVHDLAAEFRDDSLTGFTVVMDADGALAVANELRSKYGRPSVDAGVPKMNVFGAKFMARSIIWTRGDQMLAVSLNDPKFNDGRVVLRRFGSSKSKGTSPDI